MRFISISIDDNAVFSFKKISEVYGYMLRGSGEESKYSKWKESMSEQDFEKPIPEYAEFIKMFPLGDSEPVCPIIETKQEKSYKHHKIDTLVVKAENIKNEIGLGEQHVFDVEDEPYDLTDNYDKYLIWANWGIYSAVKKLSDDERDSLYNSSGDDLLVKIASISGCLILCGTIIDDGYDPWQVCDDIDGNLEYTISALQDENCPMNEEYGEPYVNVFYIHEFDMEKEYENAEIKSRMLSELPNIIMKYLHNSTDILAYIAAPINDNLRDEEMISFYEKNGFKEQGESRFLYKCIEH